MNAEEKKEILSTYKWIKIRSYEMNELLTWEERYRELEKHHIDETDFLIKKIREMVSQSPDS